VQLSTDIRKKIIDYHPIPDLALIGNELLWSLKERL